jgi:hypothetical protein
VLSWIKQAGLPASASLVILTMINDGGRSWQSIPAAVVMLAVALLTTAYMCIGAGVVGLLFWHVGKRREASGDADEP